MFIFYLIFGILLIGFILSQFILVFFEKDTPDTRVSPYQLGPNSAYFPQYPTGQQLPYQLPLAQLRPLIQTQGPVGDTGPAAVAVIGAGAAAGFSWIRRKKR
jgi:predicted permease